jgi:hypothetical protein
MKILLNIYPKTGTYKTFMHCFSIIVYQYPGTKLGHFPHPQICGLEKCKLPSTLIAAVGILTPYTPSHNSER